MLAQTYRECVSMALAAEALVLIHQAERALARGLDVIDADQIVEAVDACAGSDVQTSYTRDVVVWPK